MGKLRSAIFLLVMFLSGCTGCVHTPVAPEDIKVLPSIPDHIGYERIEGKSVRLYAPGAFRPWINPTGTERVAPPKSSQENMFAYCKELGKILRGHVSWMSDGPADWWKHPGLTLAMHGGDCEDLTILYITMLRKFFYKGKIELIVGDTPGHGEGDRSYHVWCWLPDENIVINNLYVTRETLEDQKKQGYAIWHTYEMP